jgi:hypothetical protein
VKVSSRELAMLRFASFTLAASGIRGSQFAKCAGGGSEEMQTRSLRAHTPSNNLRRIPQLQAYIASLLGRRTLGKLARSSLENDRRNGCRNALEMVVL